MTPRRFLFIIAAVAAVTANARSVAEYFVDTRADEVFSLLPTVTRLDMCDYYNSGMSTPSKNAFEGLSYIRTMNDTTMSLRYASEVDMDVILLEGKRPMLMVIETLALPELDSRVTIFNDDWTPAKTSALSLPVLADWVTDTTRLSELEQTIPFMTSTASFDPETGVLTFTPTIASYFGGERPKELALLRPAISYKWNNGKFSKLK